MGSMLFTKEYNNTKIIIIFHSLEIMKQMLQNNKQKSKYIVIQQGLVLEHYILNYLEWVIVIFFFNTNILIIVLKSPFLYTK